MFEQSLTNIAMLASDPAGNDATGAVAGSYQNEVARIIRIVNDI